MVGWKAKHCLYTLVTEITDNHWHAALVVKLSHLGFILFH